MPAVARALLARRARAGSSVSGSRCASSRCSRRRARRRSRSRAPRASSRRRPSGCRRRSRGRSAAPCRARRCSIRDSRLPRGDVDRARDVPLVPLVGLADVDEERRLGAGEELARARGVHLVDLGSHLGEQFAVGRHDFPEYSGTGSRLCLRRYPRGADERADEGRRRGRARRGGRGGRRSWAARSSSRAAARRHAAPAVTAPRPGSPPLAARPRRPRQTPRRGRSPGGDALPTRQAAPRRGASSRATTRSTAQIGAAFAAWPGGGLDTLKRSSPRIRRARPRSCTSAGRTTGPGRQRRRRDRVAAGAEGRARLAVRGLGRRRAPPLVRAAGCRTSSRLCSRRPP